jgi:hypothetical protein
MGFLVRCRKESCCENFEIVRPQQITGASAAGFAWSANIGESDITKKASQIWEALQPKRSDYFVALINFRVSD